MTDFEAFKDMMLSFKRGLEMEEAHSSVALEVTVSNGGFRCTCSLHIPCVYSGVPIMRMMAGCRSFAQKIKVHTDEMSDGDERPDLDLSLDIKAI